jgi:hypothetical protein
LASEKFPLLLLLLPSLPDFNVSFLLEGTMMMLMFSVSLL